MEDRVELCLNLLIREFLGFFLFVCFFFFLLLRWIQRQETHFSQRLSKWHNVKIRDRKRKLASREADSNLEKIE